ncbi:CHAT domain-containing protein [Pseudomonas aeruginosa]|uniref:CHAT domain-containing protein n=1 Tax=Pseudomonas aeruginosa TaxID=287 RepID=UPI002359EB6D|nr:CHAT domain-containing protein [Pseudomonas aeruginosa]WCY15437.1 CHAT domain-containing protein [Pseudomonas aeruginosa]
MEDLKDIAPLRFLSNAVNRPFTLVLICESKRGKGVHIVTSMISHLIVVPSDTQTRRTTFFQGFSDFWHPDYLNILKCITHFPHDIGDAYLFGDAYILSKNIGSSLQVKLLRADLCGFYLSATKDKNLVVWSTDLTVDAVLAAISALEIKPLHISTSYKDGAVHIGDLNKKKVREMISELLSRHAQSDPEMAEFRAFLEIAEQRHDDEKLCIEAKYHNCTEPLLDVVASYGAELRVTPIAPSGENDEHVLGMLQLAGIIDRLRPDELSEFPLRKNDAIIYCPSVYTYLYRADSVHWRELNRRLNNPKRNFLRAGLIRTKGYGNSSMITSQEDLFNPYEDEVLGPLLRDRQVELKVFTAAVALVATNQFVPAFRLPNSVMLHHDKLREIGKILSSNDRQWREKLNRNISAYGRAIRENVGTGLLAASFEGREKILAVCDFPIEWVAVDHLPAMFRFELSRVPSTPGNVVIDALVSHAKAAYSYQNLCNVLVIRSFDENDAIKDHLISGIRGRVESGRFARMSVTIVDISTKQELVDALNSFYGLMVIFDCHGSHGGEEGFAWLNIGGEKLDVWHLYQQARIPPIVILAACSTHPIEGSHASVANGFIESGVCSVIGTFAPVDSSHAAVFVTRLLERIAVYLPIVLKRREYTWREIITGLLRMSYVRDVMEGLRDRLGLVTQEQYESIHIQANMLINTHEDKLWFEKFRALIAEAARLDQDEIDKLWEEHFQFVESMLYVQLGRPENIVITAE